MKRFDLALIIGLIISVLLSSFSVFAKECEEVRASALRLHILANSDLEEDQALKLAVRDAVLLQTSDLFTGSANKAEAKAAAEKRLDEVIRIAESEIERQGYTYPVSARVVNRFFDTRVYDDFMMPAGRYDAVQIEIGQGKGTNWWCVMFPPMCIPAASEHEQTPLEEQIHQLGQPVYKPAFAMVEAIELLQQHDDKPSQNPSEQQEQATESGQENLPMIAVPMDLFERPATAFEEVNKLLLLVRNPGVLIHKPGFTPRRQQFVLKNPVFQSKDLFSIFQTSALMKAEIEKASEQLQDDMRTDTAARPMFALS